MSAMNSIPSGYKVNGCGATRESTVGYKQTEVGLIPEDWKVSTVGEEFDIQLGKMLDSEKNVGTLKPYLGNKSVQWNQIDVSDLSIMAMSPADLQRYRLVNGDLLVCEGGEVGRAAIWDEPILECYYQKALHRLRSKRGFNTALMAELLRYWVDHGLLANYVTQTSIAHLTREKFTDVPMSVPPLPEQRAIATALSDVDALLAAQDKLIAKKRDIKQAAMQQLLTGKQRLQKTVDSGELIVDSEGNPVYFSEEWEAKRLGDLLGYEQPTKYLVKDSEYSDDNDVPVLTAGKTFVLGYTNEEHGIFNSLPAIIFDDFTTANKYVTFPFKAKSSAMKILKPRDATVNLRFVFEMMQLIKFQLGDHKRYWISEFQNIQMEVPSAEEQTAIAAVLSDMDADLAALEQQRDKTRALKQGMMQELLTGRIRLV